MFDWLPSSVIKSNKLTFLGTQAERTWLKHLLDWTCYFVELCWWTLWTMQDETWNAINLTYYPQSKIYFYLSSPDFLAPEKAWVMVAYITCTSLMTARKKWILFSLQGLSSKEPQNCNYILQMFSMYLVKEKQKSLKQI